MYPRFLTMPTPSGGKIPVCASWRALWLWGEQTSVHALWRLLSDKRAASPCVRYCATVNSGYDGSLVGGLFALPRFLAMLAEDRDGPLESSIIGLVGASLLLGTFGSFLIGPLIADRSVQVARLTSNITLCAKSISTIISDTAVVFLF
jgi:hypothetical protein